MTMLKQSTLSFGNSHHIYTHPTVSHRKHAEPSISSKSTGEDTINDGCAQVKKLRTENIYSGDTLANELSSSTPLQATNSNDEQDSSGPSDSIQIPKPSTEQNTSIDLDEVDSQNEEELNDRIPNIPHKTNESAQDTSDNTRTMALNAVTSLIELADVHPQEVIPLFRVAGLVKLAAFYERLQPMWDTTVECKVSPGSRYSTMMLRDF